MGLLLVLMTIIPLIIATKLMDRRLAKLKTKRCDIHKWVSNNGLLTCQACGFRPSLED